MYDIDAIEAGRLTASMRIVAIPVFTDFMFLDVIGPADVFGAANEQLDHLGRTGERYEVTLVGANGGEAAITASNGLTLGVDSTVDAGVTTPVDTLLVPGGNGTRSAIFDAGLLHWIGSTAASARRVAAVCSGTFLLAQAGLCDGHRVTTHWKYASTLAREFPMLTVDPDPIHIKSTTPSGTIWTSAGVTAGIDLSLALVEADCGPEIAQQVARELVVYLRRPGGQSQFGGPVWADPVELQPIRSACELIHQSPDADLSIAVLARHAGLSPRHFARLFKSEVGESPARYVERVRVEAARSLLETEHVGLDQIALATGFGSAETLRRAFHRRLGVAPRDYRRHASTAS